MKMPIRRQCDAKLSCGLGIGYFFSSQVAFLVDTRQLNDRAGKKLGSPWSVVSLPGSWVVEASSEGVSGPGTASLGGPGELAAIPTLSGCVNRR